MTTADHARAARADQAEVGPFRVADCSGEELTARLVDLAASRPDGARLAFALHVGGLNTRDDRAFVAAMRQADVVYADGGSVVWLARLAGARRIERAATTDIGWDVLRGLAGRLGRPAKVALVGGPPGLAERAGAALAAGGAATVVHTDHGYHEDWAAPLAALRAAAPEVTVVGLGAPREMVWSLAHRAELPPGLVLTCGGWFGYLAGEERRAPRLLRRPGLEWLARVAQQPLRLGPRYLRGVLTTAVLALHTVRRRRAGRAGR